MEYFNRVRTYLKRVMNEPSRTETAGFAVLGFVTVDVFLMLVL